MTKLSSQQLKEAASIQEQIEALQVKLDTLMNGGAASGVNIASGIESGIAPQSASNVIPAGIPVSNGTIATKGVGKGRNMSPAGRKKIAAAQRARWARIRQATRQVAAAAPVAGQ